MARAWGWIAAIGAAMAFAGCSGSSNPLIQGTSGTVAGSTTGATAATGSSGSTGTSSTSSSSSGSTGATGFTTGTIGTTGSSGSLPTTTTGGAMGTTGTSSSTASSSASSSSSSSSGSTGTTSTSSSSSSSGSTGSTGTTGTGTLHATAQPGPASGWKVLTGPGTIRDASADEGGNIWVAGGEGGLYLLRAGSNSFQRFGTGDGLHPYGYPSTGSITQVYLNVISVAGGAAGNAYVGYQGMTGCEDEWDQNASNPDPNIYKSGDADHVWLNGSGIGVAHYDIYTGPGIVAAEPRGREKLCSIYRIAYDGAHGNVWVGANHGYAWLNPGYTGSPFYSGNDSLAVLQEHAHPAISGYVRENQDPASEYLLTGGYYGLSLEPNGDVWVGGIYRTYRCAGGNGGVNFWGCEADDQNLSHQVDIWPDLYPTDTYPSQRTDDYVMGLAVVGDGSVWAAARHSADDPSQPVGLGLGLAHLSPTGQLLGTMTDALTSNHLTALAADVDGTLWVGSDSGLMRYDPVAGVVYQFGSDAVGGFAHGYVANIQVDTHSSPRRVLVSFLGGGLGIYTGN